MTKSCYIQLKHVQLSLKSQDLGAIQLAASQCWLEVTEFSFVVAALYCLNRLSCAVKRYTILTPILGWSRNFGLLRAAKTAYSDTSGWTDQPIPHQIPGSLSARA